MSWNDLRQFVSHLETQGELHRIGVPVDPRHEVTAIADRVAKQPAGGPALLFEQVIGSTMPLAMNLYGSAGRMALALGVDRGYLETTSFQARPFYEKMGYEVFAELEDQPPGHTCYYLKKIGFRQTP